MPVGMLSASDRARGFKRARITQSLAQCIREGAPVELLREYWMARAEGLHNVKLARDEETGEFYVTHTPDEDLAPGTPPVPQEEIDKAMQWLSDRGYGLPAQNIQLEANIRQHTTSVLAHLPIGDLSPAAIATIRGALALGKSNAGALSPGAPSNVIDAESVDAEPGEASSGEPVPVSRGNGT